jgi:integrase/recombinase XerD
MSPLRSALRDYLTIRRQLGFKLEQDGRMLESFVDFLEEAGAAQITTGLALAWARRSGEAHSYHCRQRLSVVRSFARHLATIDPDSEVPPEDLLPAHRRRATPHIYSPVEIAALMGAARKLTPPLRAASFETVIGLLAASGVRIGEALALERDDVDLKEGALHVRTAKRNSAREVPLHASTTEALRRYARLRDRRRPKPQTPAFFLGARGERLMVRTFECTFRKLIQETGLEGRGARRRPRPHDLRHTFAVLTLLDWYRTEEDVDRKMPLLSTYLGHVSPSSTYWYLQAAPELLELVSGRLDRLQTEEPS